MLVGNFQNLPFLIISEETLPQFKVFPNPVKSVLYLDIHEQEKIKGVTITDVFGRTIHSLIFENGQIDCSTSANRPYFLEVETNLAAQMLRFMKLN